jgi:RND family efflux transporter MFP subunit
VLSFLVLVLLLPMQAAAGESPGPMRQKGVFVARPAMREVTLIGYTRARHVMDIVSEEAGRCLQVTADVGDSISKEGIFAVLDTTFIDIAIKKNRVHQERLQNMVAYHAKEVRRFEALVDRETAAQANLDALQNKLDQAEFQIEELKVEETQLRERRVRHLIKVPEDWTVVERGVEPGEWISVGQHLGKAGDFRTLLVPFSLSPSEYSALLRLKGQVELVMTDESEQGLVLKAVVERVSPAFDPETRKINVDLGVSKGIPKKRGGLRAELTLDIPDPSGAVLVPTVAVVERYEEFYLTRVSGERVRVLLLGNGPENTSRVRSPEVKPGNQFKLAE